MTDVFISYKREDRPLADALAAHLQTSGFTVWWDTTLLAGERFNDAIADALDAAKCVVVLWNERSNASQYVEAEASKGFDRKILVAARLDDVTLRYPFQIIETADLRGWAGESEHPGLQRIIAGVRAKAANALAASDRSPAFQGDAPILGKPARKDDPSIWSDPSASFEFQEARSFFQMRSLTVEDGPRAYIRVIPSGWRDGPPAISEFAKLASAFAVSAPSNGYDSGTFGFAYFGALQFWFSGHGYDPERGYRTRNACLYFDDTGEFWFVHGTAVLASSASEHLVFIEPVVANWSKALRKTMRVFDQYGANQQRRVELGLVGLANTFWPATPHASANPRARKSSVTVQRQAADWAEDQQQAILRHPYNEVRGAFSLHKLDQKQFLADVNAFDSERFSAK